MKILIELNDCIRDSYPLWEDFIKGKKEDTSPEKIRKFFFMPSLIKEEFLLKDSHEEWYDMQSLAPSFIQSEIKINDWYDQGTKQISIFTDDYNKNDKKWLNDHHIPFDFFIETSDIIFLNSMVNFNHLIISNYKKCLKPKITGYFEKIFIMKNENNTLENILRETGLTSLPENVFLVNWEQINI